MTIPSGLKERYLQVQLIHEEAIQEQYRQEYALIVKNTEKLTEALMNTGKHNVAGYY